MRGNHIYCGRQDYVEPPPMIEEDRRMVSLVSITLTEGKKTWRSAMIDGDIIGYVRTGMDGQSYRTASMDFWMPVASDWNKSDPPYGYAILALMRRYNA